MMPGAMYDLSGRISAANAVASCALNSLPVGSNAYDAINHVGNLISAIQSLLDQADKDVEELERQLNTPG